MTKQGFAAGTSGETARVFPGWCALLALLFVACAEAASPTPQAESLARRLDAPLLFVKRHSFTNMHIHDTYYKWLPGGGIHILENPAAPRPVAHPRVDLPGGKVWTAPAGSSRWWNPRCCHPLI